MGRRNDIVDAVETRLNAISIINGYNLDIALVKRRFIHWEALDADGHLPAILILPGTDGNKTDSGEARFAHIAEIEEVYPLTLYGMVKETNGDDIVTLTNHIHDDIEKALGGSDATLGISGVHDAQLGQFRTLEGLGREYEVFRIRLNVTHTYEKGQVP